MRQRGARILLIGVMWTMAVAASGAILVSGAEPAAACSCATTTDEEARVTADAVFSGRLIEIVTPEGGTYSSADPERFLFEVDEVFEGTVYAEQAVVTARDGMSCGLEISGPGPFVVFAYAGSDGVTTGALEGELYSNLCSGSRALSHGAVPSSFGTGAPPIAGASAIGGAVPAGGRRGGAPADESGGGAPTVLFVVIVGATALLGAAYVSRRR